MTGLKTRNCCSGSPKRPVAGNDVLTAAAIFCLQQLPKLLNRQAGVTRNTAHGECVDRIVTGYGQDAQTITHDDVFSLTHNPEPGLFQCPHGIKVIDTRKLWQG